jgi:opacity protein-like surface antigen
MGKNLLLFALFFAGIMQSLSLANAQSNSIPLVDSKTGKADPKKPKNTNQAVAQGLSIAESMLLSENPWGIFFNATATRGLDEFSDTWTSVNELNLSYRLDQSSALGLNIGYETLIYEKGGSLFNNMDNDPERFGVTDLDITYTRPKVWSDKYNTLVWSSALTFPSSRLSQRNSLTIEATSSLAMRYRPNSKLMITPAIGAYGREFRYETSSAVGREYNSPFGTSFSLSGAYTFHKRVIGNLSYGNSLRYDYYGDWRTVQTVIVGLNTNVTDTLNISFGYRYRDRTITNDPAFDDDKSIYYIGVGYVF